MRKARPYKLVLVEWLDAQSQQDGWAPIGSLQPHLPSILSVGWLVAESREAITLVMNVGGIDVPMGSNDITIPRGMVKKVCVLR